MSLNCSLPWAQQLVFVDIEIDFPAMFKIGGLYRALCQKRFGVGHSSLSFWFLVSSFWFVVCGLLSSLQKLPPKL
jgi:hypothetical protein